MKTLFITGGAGEIGSAIIQRFQENEYQVIAPSRKEMNLGDVNSIMAYMNYFSSTVDVFIHCAGFNQPKSFAEIKPEDLNNTLLVNSMAFYYITQALIKANQFKNNSYILGISSIYGIIARKKRFSYAAAKHCLNGMIKSLALDLAHLGIKVNSLAPGFVATRMTYQNNTPEKIKELVEKIPLKTLASPDDIAKTAYYLCSPDNTYITGQTIIADGGYTVGGFED